MTMIAMTMLPDMVVVVLEGLCCGDLGGFEGLGWWWFMREMCFLSVYSSGRVELVSCGVVGRVLFVKKSIAETEFEYRSDLVVLMRWELIKRALI
jgi:hypothetical protein